MAEKLSELVNILNKLLPPNEFQDSNLNGLQVEASNSLIAKVGLAVDGGLSIFQEAIRQKCKLLIVHHGIFWGSEQSITGVFAKKISTLMDGGCSLYASHLPLDAHPKVGNNHEVARFFNLKVGPTFANFHGKHIGVTATTRKSEALSLDYFVERSQEMLGATSQILFPFGPKKIQRVGIVTGSGSMAIAEAAALGLDLLITGEPKQSAYHEAREQKMNVLFAGHYATETFGVRAVGAWLETNYKLKTVFIDEPTGI